MSGVNGQSPWGSLRKEQHSKRAPMKGDKPAG